MPSPPRSRTWARQHKLKWTEGGAGRAIGIEPDCPQTPEPVPRRPLGERGPPHFAPRATGRGRRPAPAPASERGTAPPAVRSPSPLGRAGSSARAPSVGGRDSAAPSGCASALVPLAVCAPRPTRARSTGRRHGSAPPASAPRAPRSPRPALPQSGCLLSFAFDGWPTPSARGGPCSAQKASITACSGWTDYLPPRARPLVQIPPRHPRGARSVELEPLHRRRVVELGRTSPASQETG